jgi:hypothetical protein
MSSVYVLGTYHHHINHELFQTELVNCEVTVFDWEKEELTENSLIISDPSWINLQHLTESQIEQAKNVASKKMLLIFDYKSFYSKTNMINQVNEALLKMNFDFSNVHIITQLEYDIHAIKRIMPEVNVVSRDRWLKELFRMQIIPHAFEKRVEVDTTAIANKRFSLFIRRHQKARFEFLCSLIALGLEPQLHYTFANTESDMLPESFKEIIPERLSHARHILEPWVEGIPYTIPNEQYDHRHYPMNLKHYCEKSDINIVFETEPFGEHSEYSYQGFGSFLTEKTYKAILFKKPFILVSEQHGLKALHAFGFKTFSPWFNESYDDIEDFDQRVEAVLAEINRLSLLSEDEIATILREVNDIVEHNHRVLFDLAIAPLPDQFKLKSLLTF